jgi:hypothetical protein
MESRECLGFLFLTLSISLSGCDSQKPLADDLRAQKPAQQQFANIERLDRQSCLCKLVGRETAKIDAELQNATKSLKVEQIAESSAPLAGIYDCYPEIGNKACLSKYYQVAAPNEPHICDLGQVERLETVWKSVPSDTDHRGDKANAAMLGELAKLKDDAEE